MEEDENIKKTENELEYEEFTIENLTKEIKNLKKKNKIFRKFTKK